jgi:DNA-binding transcriptional LysR family regulator
MNLTHLRTFVAVAEQRHFARAASLCNLSQPAVSHQIAQLEAEVGARLLNRTGRRVSTTVAGDVMLEEARRILAAVDRARERLEEVARGGIGRIRLGASPTPGLYLLPALLARYRHAHPTFDLRFSIAPVHQLCEQVARNDLDMAVIAGAPPTSELRLRPLGRDRLVLIAPPDGKPVRAAASARDLARSCWILREEGSETRRQTLHWLRQHDVHPERTMTFDGPDAVKRAVMAGLGIAIVSRLTVEEEVSARRLLVVRTKAALPPRDFALIDHPQKHHGAACTAMLALLSEP